MEFPNDPKVLQQMVNELVTELQGVQGLAKSEDRLNAVAPGKIGDGKNRLAPVAPTSLGKDEDAPEGSASSAGADAGGPPPDAGAGDAPPPSDPSAGAPPPGADPAAAAGPAADAPPTVEELVPMYEQLPPDQLAIHLQACTMAAQKLGLGGGAGGPPPGADPMAGAGGPPPGAPSPSPAGPPPGLGASPSPGGPPPGAPPEMAALKSELEDLRNQLKKASDDNTATREAAEKSTERVVNVLQKLTGEPMKKSINGINYFTRPVTPASTATPLKKSVGEMTKQEIRSKLDSVVKSPKLTKNDRDLINKYVFDPASVSLDQLEKLFQ